MRSPTGMASALRRGVGTAAVVKLNMAKSTIHPTSCVLLPRADDRDTVSPRAAASSTRAGRRGRPCERRAPGVVARRARKSAGDMAPTAAHASRARAACARRARTRARERAWRRERERERARARELAGGEPESPRQTARTRAMGATRGLPLGRRKGEGLGQDAGTASQKRCLRASSSALRVHKQRRLPSSEASRAQALAPPKSFRHARVDAHELEGSRGQRCRPSGSAEPYGGSDAEARPEASTGPGVIIRLLVHRHRSVIVTSSAVSHNSFGEF